MFYVIRIRAPTPHTQLLHIPILALLRSPKTFALSSVETYAYPPNFDATKRQSQRPAVLFASAVLTFAVTITRKSCQRVWRK